MLLLLNLLTHPMTRVVFPVAFVISYNYRTIRKKLKVLAINKACEIITTYVGKTTMYLCFDGSHSKLLRPNLNAIFPLLGACQ
jgi:hypothetical protein